MTNMELATIVAAVHDWKLPGHLCGTGALMVCAGTAIDHQRKGEDWTPMGVAQEYAEKKGGTQHAVWQSMCYALERGRGAQTPGEAITSIVLGAYRNGCFG